MFPTFHWFPPADTDVDGIAWAGVLNGFQCFHPRIIVPGHGDPGTIDIALDLVSHIEAVGRQVRALRAGGKSAAAVMRDDKPAMVAAHPDSEHASLLDWEINYFAAQRA